MVLDPGGRDRKKGAINSWFPFAANLQLNFCLCILTENDEGAESKEDDEE